jgi:hypothetical protein
MLLQKPSKINKKILLTFFLLPFCNSCVSPDLLTVIVPHGYEGNIYIAFDIKGGEKIIQKNKVLFIEDKNFPFIILSDKYHDNLVSLRGIFFDTLTHKDINYGDKRYGYMRVFFSKIDTLDINNQRIIYSSSFVTKDFFQKTDTALLNKVKQYNYQFDEFKNEIAKKIN